MSPRPRADWNCLPLPRRLNHPGQDLARVTLDGCVVGSQAVRSIVVLGEIEQLAANVRGSQAIKFDRR